MPTYLLVASLIILLCVLLNRFTNRIGMPVLLAFILLGMTFGSDGLFGIPFDNFILAEQVCSISLIFIMFYGGFGTNWNEAKPVAVKSVLLSTWGVVVTAALTGLFCRIALGLGWGESMLIGAVTSSTDAASVFSILRSKNLGLRENTASMLELESGSNDPFSYMLTAIMLSVISGKASGPALAYLVFSQLAYGILCGVAIALCTRAFLRHYRFVTPGFDMAFLLGVAVLSYALPAWIGGNGYMSAYIVGILLGNTKLRSKGSLVHFFDGLTSLMQMLIFFLLGLLATPSKLPALLPSALAIALFLTFVSRPLAIFSVLTPARCSLRQQILVSFAGLRGAASIVFAIMTVVQQTPIQSDLFHIVFCIVLLSIAVQGSLLAPVAHRLQMCDQSIDVLKTFSDYSEEVDLRFIQLTLPPKHQWVGMAVRALAFPPDILIVMLLRGGETVIPGGQTILQAGDIVVISAHAYQELDGIGLTEQQIGPHSPWVGKPISEFSPTAGELVLMILRQDKTVVPKGDTIIESGDILVISALQEQPV